MCIVVCIFYINNTAKGNTSLMLNKLLLLINKTDLRRAGGTVHL